MSVNVATTTSLATRNGIDSTTFWGWLCETDLSRGISYADVSGIRAGTEHGWHRTEWLDRNEVSSRRAVLRSFIFAVFWRLDNRHLLFARLRIKSEFFSGRTRRTGCPTIKKQQRHRRTTRRNLLSFLSKPLCQMPPVFCACPNPGNCVLETVG